MNFFKNIINLADKYKMLNSTDIVKLIQEQHEKQKGDLIQKKAELMALYKLVYLKKFKACRNVDEVLYAYVKNTDTEAYFEESRLEYVSSYLFNNYMVKDKVDSESLSKFLIKIIAEGQKNDNQNSSTLSRPETNEHAEREASQTVLQKSPLYNELREYLEDQITSLQKNGSRIDEDELFISIFSNIRFGMQVVEQNHFLNTLINVMEDLDLITKEIMSDSELKSYIKQRLLTFKKVEYWDEAEQKACKSFILMMGRYIRIFSDDFLRTVSARTDDPISVICEALDDTEKFKLYINGTVFIADVSDKDKITKYFKKINKEIIEYVNLKVQVLEEYIKKVSPELKEIINDSLHTIPIMVFLDQDNFAAFEYLISSSSFLARQMIDCDAEQLANIAENLKNDSVFYNNISSIVDSSFSELCKIADKYINIPAEYHSPIIWILMRQASLTYLSEQWKKEYGMHLNDAGITNVDDYVDVYCRCPGIPTKNIKAVGMFTYYLMGRHMFPADINSNFLKCCKVLVKKLLLKFKEIEAERAKEIRAKKQAAKEQAAKEEAENKYSINDVDVMSGNEIEEFINILFQKMGYTNEAAKRLRNQPPDIIAEKNGTRIGIRIICSNKEPEKDVQELAASLERYQCSKGIVVSSSYFSDAALEASQANNIVLWDRDILKKKIEEI